jgi:glycerol-3-phosphate dehydrogenase
MSIENAHDLFVTDGDINDCGIACDAADRGALINPRAYFFQNPDGWIIFAIPCENDFTLIGTTDLDYHHNPVKPEDTVWSFSSVRPLFDDGASKAQEATRYYVLKLENSPALMNVFGGKLTTYRRLFEHVLGKIREAIGIHGSASTVQSHRHGGKFGAGKFSAEVKKFIAACPFLSDRHAEPGVLLWYDGCERFRHSAGFERPEASFRSNSPWRVGVLAARTRKSADCGRYFMA